jgi:mRNA interferase MazF
MTKLTAICNRFDIVKIPFPFTDRRAHKNRPAVIVSASQSFNQLIGHSIMAMITSAQHTAWPLDTPINDLDSAGLPAASIIRLKLFTLDHRLIIDSLGHLSTKDTLAFTNNLATLFSDS